MSWTIQMNWRCSHCKNLNPGMEGKERESLRCMKCGAGKTNETRAGGFTLMRRKRR